MPFSLSAFFVQLKGNNELFLQIAISRAYFIIIPSLTQEKNMKQTKFALAFPD